VCDLETSRMGAPYIYDFSRLRVKETKGIFTSLYKDLECGGSVPESCFKELYRHWTDGNRKCR